MAIENWSDDILVTELADNPQFSEELTTLSEMVETKPVHAILNMAGVNYLNSSDLSRLLRLRKSLVSGHRRVILCGLNDPVWGVFLVTGLDKIFEFADDITMALATLQLSAPAKPAKKPGKA